MLSTPVLIYLFLARANESFASQPPVCPIKLKVRTPSDDRPDSQMRGGSIPGLIGISVIFAFAGVRPGRLLFLPRGHFCVLTAHSVSAKG